MRFPAFWGLGVVTACAALASGCGGDVSVPAEEGGGGAGATGTATGATTGAGGGGVCADFADAGPEDAQPATIRFRNDTLQDVYLPGGCSQPSFRLGSEADGDPAHYGRERVCLQSCEDLQTDPQFACAPCAPVSFRIPPGGTLDHAWDGLGLRAESMPPECYLEGSGGPTCERVVAAPPGQYSAAATGYAACEGGCTCDASGKCNGFVAGQAAEATPAKFTHPAGAVVEVVFEACAFGCPQKE